MILMKSFRGSKTKTEPDISEPIYTFVDSFKKNPKKFRIHLDNDLNYIVVYEGVSLGWFRPNDKPYFHRRYSDMYIVDLRCDEFELTNDEKQYIKEQLTPLWIQSIKRMHHLHDLKAFRKGRVARKRLLGIFKGEN